MYQAEGLPVTSINSLISTIRIDKQVYRWFVHLTVQPMVKKELSENKKIATAYKRIENILYQEKIMFFFLFCALFFTVITRQFQYGFLVIIFFIVHVFLHMKKKKDIIQICFFLLNKDFHKSLFAQKTLYQIGEFYSQEYNIIPLVDAMTSVDAVTRKAVFYTIVFTIFIYPLNFWQTCGFVFMAYYISYEFMNTTFIYKRIK